MSASLSLAVNVFKIIYIFKAVPLESHHMALYLNKSSEKLHPCFLKLNKCGNAPANWQLHQRPESQSKRARLCVCTRLRARSKVCMNCTAVDR